MARRKITPKKQKNSREPLRFTPGEIVRAIEAVQAAGLTVYGVQEITLAGATNITTQPPPIVSKRPATPRQVSKPIGGRDSTRQEAGLTFLMDANSKGAVVALSIVIALFGLDLCRWGRPHSLR